MIIHKRAQNDTLGYHREPKTTTKALMELSVLFVGSDIGEIVAWTEECLP